jgi:hypothetical protein
VGFSFRALGRAIDPTSSKAPLGGLVKSAIPFVPFVGPAAATALNVAQSVKSATAKPPESRTPAAVFGSGDAGVTALPPSPNAPPRPAPSKLGELWSKVSTPLGLAVVGVLLVVLVVLRKSK